MLTLPLKFCKSEKKMIDFNKAAMDKIGNARTIRAKEVRDRDFIFSYDLTSKLDSKYILKTIMKHFIERKGREKEHSNLLVYEHFDTTFEEWLKAFLQILQRWYQNVYKPTSLSVSFPFPFAL